MGKQWVRHEIQRNELAVRVESVAAKVQAHRQTAIAIAGGIVAVLIAIGIGWARMSRVRNETWEKLAIAQSYAYQGQAKAAQEQLQPVLESGSVPASYALLFAGDLQYKNGEYKEAAASYQKLVDRQGPKAILPVAMADLGLALEAGGDCKGSVEATQRFLDSHQDHFMAPQAHASMARCLLLLGQTAQAKSTLDRIVLLYPDTYWAQWSRDRLNPKAPAPQPPAAPAPRAAAPAKPAAPVAAAAPQAAPASPAPAQSGAPATAETPAPAQPPAQAAPTAAPAPKAPPAKSP